VYALIRAFASNHVRFHAADGSGYAFLADQVIRLDALNPQVAARMARAFDRWKRIRRRAAGPGARGARADPGRKSLSRDVGEIVTKALA
jgi:aminopeptidase N